LFLLTNKDEQSLTQGDFYNKGTHTHLRNQPQQRESNS